VRPVGASPCRAAGDLDRSGVDVARANTVCAKEFDRVLALILQDALMADGVDADDIPESMQTTGRSAPQGSRPHRMVPGSLVTVTLLIALLGEGWLG
jgi:hypothetical protein